MQYVERDDGVFWMPFSEFQKFFVSIHICKYVHGYVFKNLRKQETTQKFHVFDATLVKSGNYTFSISQKDKNCYEYGREVKYSSCRFILVKLVNDLDMSKGVEFVKGCFESWERDYYLECKNLKAGKYQAFAEFDWDKGTQEEEKVFNITSYGIGPVMFTDVSATINKEEFLKAAFIAKLKKTQIGLHKIDMTDKLAPKIKRYFECNFPEGYMYVIIKNNDPEATYFERVTFDKFQRLDMCPPHSGHSYQISVGPQFTNIVLIRAKRGANFTIESLHQNVFLGDKALREICLNENFKVSRLRDEIVLYKAWHDNGFVALYQNNSEDKFYTETIRYFLQGLVLEGIEGDSTMQIKLAPGEEKLIKLSNKGETGDRNLESQIVEKYIEVKMEEDE